MLRIVPGVDVLEAHASAAKRIFKEKGLEVIGEEFTEGANAKTKSIVEDYSPKAPSGRNQELTILTHIGVPISIKRPVSAKPPVSASRLKIEMLSAFWLAEKTYLPVGVRARLRGVAPPQGMYPSLVSPPVS